LSSGAYEEGWYVPAIYGRGPVFVLTLAETMGQESFETFLYDYSQTYKWEIARGEDFRRMAERQCDCDLESLFAEWVYAE
jgi:aminopeptidase N